MSTSSLVKSPKKTPGLNSLLLVMQRQIPAQASVMEVSLLEAAERLNVSDTLTELAFCLEKENSLVLEKEVKVDLVSLVKESCEFVVPEVQIIGSDFLV